jgi:hypothetical protein
MHSESFTGSSAAFIDVLDTTRDARKALELVCPLDLDGLIAANFGSSIAQEND